EDVGFEIGVRAGVAHRASAFAPPKATRRELEAGSPKLEAARFIDFRTWKHGLAPLPLGAGGAGRSGGLFLGRLLGPVEAGRVVPEGLEVVELAVVLAEDVQDEVAEVLEDPGGAA